jgi:hypothetical protein
MKAIYQCLGVSFKIVGREFCANFIVLDSKGIDIILGVGWLSKVDAVIQCAKRSVILIAVTCGVRVVLRQLHRLFLNVSVHLASFMVAVVVVIVIFDYHELGLQLLGLLPVGHFLRMMDRVRQSTGALIAGLLGCSHL